MLGRSPRDVAAKREIGYLPEESHFYKFLTARETLDFYARLFNLGRSARAGRVAQLLDMVALTPAADRPVGEFSKGMARRVGLAQALINDPRLVILDEPTAGLDPIGCRQVKDLLLALVRRGNTILLCSHLLADVEDVCDRIAILFNGRIYAHGTVKGLLEQRDHARVTLPPLPPDELRNLLATIRARLGAEPAVDYPLVRLERFFLEVVAQAHAAAGLAPGSSAPRLADFLQRDRDAEDHGR